MHTVTSADLGLSPGTSSTSVLRLRCVVFPRFFLATYSSLSAKEKRRHLDVIYNREQVRNAVLR